MSSTSQPSRRQIMQPWPLCLASFGKPKERAILPKQYSRVPSIARTGCSSNRQLLQDCSSNSTLFTQVSPFASQLVIEQQQQQQQQHYYADNLRNNRPKAFDGSPIYNSDHYSKQLDPLLGKDVPASDTKIFMESQDLKKPAAQAGSIPQFQKEPRRRRPYYLSQVLAAFSVSIGSMVVGFASSYTSPALVTMKDNSTTPFLVDEATSSWIGSIMPLSALIGGIVGGPLIENVGRRNTILSLSVPFFLSWLLIGLAYNVGMVLGGRSLSGFCVGVLTLAMPVYLGETIQPEVRGTLGLLPTAFGNIGILLCFTVGMFLNWWQLALAGALIPIPFGVLMFMIPETPRWYIAKGQAKRARASLQWLRGRQADVSDELASVERLHVESERQAANHSVLSELFKGRNLKPLAISLGLMFFQQMSGINAVIFYTVNIFMESGSDINENISTIIVGVVNFASTFLATAVIDHLGRKVLLYISSLSMIASLATLGVFFYLKNGHYDVQSLGWLPLASFVVYVLGFSLGFGPVPWLMMGEILPAKIRGSAASIVTGFNWSCTFVVTKMFTDLTLIIGWAGTFWLFGFICVCGFVFVLLCVPETSGRSLEEIERGLTGGGGARTTSVRRMSAVANIKPTPMGC